jgi:hypothetical protein
MTSRSLNSFFTGATFTFLVGPFAWCEDPHHPDFVAVVDKQRQIYDSSAASLENRISALKIVSHICQTSKDSKSQVLGLEFLSVASISSDSQFILRAAASNCLNEVVGKFVETKDQNTLTAMAKVQIVLDSETSELPLQLAALKKIYEAGSGDDKSTELLAFTRNSLTKTSNSATKSTILVALASDKLATLEKLKPLAIPASQTTPNSLTAPPNLSGQPLAASDFGQSAGNANTASSRLGVSATRGYDASRDFLDGKRIFTKPKTEAKKGNNKGATPASGATGLTFKPSDKL